MSRTSARPIYGTRDTRPSSQYWRGTPEVFQLMHHSFMLVDQDDPAGAQPYNGSANYSAKALKYKRDALQGGRSSARSSTRSARFAKMFADAKDQDGMAADGHPVPACPLGDSEI